MQGITISYSHIVPSKLSMYNPRPVYIVIWVLHNISSCNNNVPHAALGLPVRIVQVMISGPQPHVFKVQRSRALRDMHCQKSSDAIGVHRCWRSGNIWRGRALRKL